MSMLTGMPHVWQQIVLPSSQPFDTGLGLKHMVPTLPLWALTSSKSALFILYAGYLLIVPTSSNTSTALSMGAPNSFCVAVYPDVLGQNALPKRIIHSNDSPIGEEAAMNFEDLSPELRKKAKACENPEEMIALAKEEGYELSNEELDAISGGKWHPCWDNQPPCEYF